MLPPPSSDLGTFTTIAVTLRFFVKSGAQLGGLNRLTLSASGSVAPCRNASPLQFGASRAHSVCPAVVQLGSPAPPGPPKNRAARNARTWKNRLTSKKNESER